MAIYKLKQKFLSLSEKFDVKNEQEESVYTVEGKFFSVGKQFTLANTNAKIITERFFFIPKSYMVMNI